MTTVGLALAIAMFSGGLAVSATAQEATDLGNGELASGEIGLASRPCATGDVCFDECTTWYEVTQLGNRSTPETNTLELTPKNLSASNCSCATGSGVANASTTTAYRITFSDNTTGFVEVDAEFLDTLRFQFFQFEPSGCEMEFKVTAGTVLGVKAPTNVVTREAFLEVFVILMIAISALCIVAVFLFGRFARDKTVYIELDG